MDDLTFEDKIALLVMAKDQKAKAELIARWSNDPEFHFGINARTMPLAEYMKQGKFDATAKHAKELRKHLANRGWNKSKSGRLIAEIPADVFYNRPELNAHLPQKVFKANIEKFLKEFPAFKVTE